TVFFFSLIISLIRSIFKVLKDRYILRKSKKLLLRTASDFSNNPIISATTQAIPDRLRLAIGHFVVSTTTASEESASILPLSLPDKYLRCKETKSYFTKQ